MELFRRYDPATPPEERKGSPICVVSHPDAGGPCGAPAVGEVWSLPFCEAHWREAELAAREELHDTVENELEVLTDAEEHRHDANRTVVAALKRAEVPGLRWSLEDHAAYEAALKEAFPPERIEGNTLRDTLDYDYGRDYAGDGPYDWWSDACVLLVRFLRQASEMGLPLLTRELEMLREWATAQRVLAKADYERRWAAPKERENAGTEARDV